MNRIKLLATIVLLVISVSLNAQQKELIPDLSKATDAQVWTVHNRDVAYEEGAHLNGKPGDGFLRLNGKTFANGSIELDIKGVDEQGRSFVGFAFHGLNDSTYDVIYFRPFNFRNPQRNRHSVQYVSLPENDWYTLRTDHPGKYENLIIPAPIPADWFHAAITIEYPVVKVFVNNAKEPSLIVNQLSSRKNGWIGFWVGNTSEGWFKNLKITSK